MVAGALRARKRTQAAEIAFAAFARRRVRALSSSPGGLRVSWAPVTEAPRVLIVEDDADAAELTARRLASGSIPAEICLGAHGSLAAFGEGQFALVILDVDMPGLEGTKLIQGFWERAEHQRPWILLYSNYDAKTLEEAARRHGAHAWLQKSASKAELVARVRELLAQPAPQGSA